ncbi:MAG: alginate export family protein, partial [Verrucomicrobia bacterium]|nr:alginate export family protein [Verrucomicrobiota bacterium]
LRGAGCGVLALLAVSAEAATSESASGGAFRPVATRAIGADRVADRPNYAHSLTEIGRLHDWKALDSVDWLDAGIHSRFRYEIRENDYRTPGLVSDDALVTQTLVYLGVRHAVDPLRFAGEFQDSRRLLSERAPLPNEVNYTEVLQAHADLHFENVVDGNPLTLMGGRMTFDAVDRRLVARNRFRNSINAFDGVRGRLGGERDRWEVDGFALRPVERDVDDFDESYNSSWLYGVTGYWRAGSPGIEVEPYWLLLNQDARQGIPLRRTLHTFGFHAFGQWDGSRWDYDASFAGQLGETRGLAHQAWAGHVEAGYSWPVDWKPRLALWFNYASGDQDPGDDSQQRFDPLFGANFAFYGYSGYFSWQNILDPAVRFSVEPVPRLRTEIILRSVWLASDRDAWVRGLRVDPTGDSGAYVGQELDLRVAYPVRTWCDLEVVYAHFFPGSFVTNTGADPGSEFLYLQAVLKL